MTVRTLIEISAETEWDHAAQLKATLDKLGYEPKAGEEHGRWMAELWDVFREQNIDPHKLIEERRARIQAEYAAQTSKA